MSRGFWCALVAVVVLSSAPVAAGADEPMQVFQRWAVLVGVDDYAYAQKLNYCGADQTALRDQLIAAGFPEDQVFLLHDKAESPRFRPSQGNIERQLNLVLSLADERDLIVIAFSGHGVHLDGKSFLCPGDCTLDDPATLISVDGMYDRLKDCAAEFKLVLVDACRNDPRPGGSRSMTATDGSRALARSLQEVKLPQGVVLLNSCAPGEVSWEDERFGHGVFMHYLLDGLKGAADASGDGHVSLNEMQRYAGQRTKTYVANRHSVAQRPFFRGDLSTEALEFALLPVPKQAVNRFADGSGPDAAMTALQGAIVRGDAKAVWKLLPKRYQDDLVNLKNSLADQVDADLWNRTHPVAAKLVQLCQEKKDLVLGSMLLAEVPEDQKRNADVYWDSAMTMLAAVASAETQTHEQFKQVDPERFLATVGNPIVAEMMKIAEKETAGFVDDLKRIRGTKFAVAREAGEVVFVSFANPDGEVTEKSFVRVDGRWVPQDMTENWDKSMAEAQAAVAKIGPALTPQIKAQILTVLPIIDRHIEPLRAAKYQGEFDGVLLKAAVEIQTAVTGQAPQ